MKQYRILECLDVSPAFVALLCAYFYFDPAQTFFPFLFAVTLHEAGHLLALRLMGARVHKISFHIAGAVIHTQPLRYSMELLAAAAGPLTNGICAAVFLHRYPRFALIHLLLLFYNLLPFYPLDGGRILRALLHLLLNEPVATVIEKIIASVTLLLLVAFSCYLTCVWHAGLWPVLICALLLVRVAGTILPVRKRGALWRKSQKVR